MKVYTGRGDDGTTGLLYGGRVTKWAAGPEAYGTVDEAVAALGLARAECEVGTPLHDLVVALQKDLFVAGAELATLPENRDKLVPGETRVSDGMCDRLRSEIDDLEARLPELTEFVLPGADRLSAALDFARTVVRRAERRAAEISQTPGMEDTLVVKWLNRLGDLVYLLARDAETQRRTLHGD
ncbi:MAG: cob(I)yrinic acid a,c-diamide adenosyltransferase [Acidimicrobiia bacterium]|nr:cob(I)yrinic acid a,c-diamide adenosyltransferase [Acidimicrobiia bacterium]